MSVSLFDYFAVEADLGPTRESDAPVPLQYKVTKPVSRPLTNGTFEPYRVQRMAIAGGRAHPTPLVESAAMASIAPPIPKYKPVLEPSIISRGQLSAEQLEVITYAGEQHSKTFTMADTLGNPKTYRNGFYIADGAGAAKGRCVAGIIKSNFNEGRDIAVWFSARPSLYKDAVRDWTDIGGALSVMHKWSGSLDEVQTLKPGTILFGSYTMLRSRRFETTINDKGQKQRTIAARRLDQFINALPPNFDGVIVFDEAGELENADPQLSERGNHRGSSLQGEVALELQERLPNARIVYVSATGTSRLDGLAYASRLQLWGEGTGFASKKHFVEAMREGGTAAMEVICRELKAQGRLCARTLSYEGVQYQRITHEMDREQIDMYNAYTRTWRMIEQGFTDELLRQGAIVAPTDGSLTYKGLVGSPLGRINSQTQSAKQRFFAQALMSMKWPSTQTYIEQQVAAGNAVVIQLTHTNESQLNRALTHMTEEETLDDLEISHRQFMTDFIRKHYPIGKFRTEWKDRAMHVMPILDRDQQQVIDPKAVARRDALIAQIDELVFPDTILELIHDAFGDDRVAEVTGRKHKLVRKIGPGGKVERVLIKRGTNESPKEIRAFLDDRKQILVFSEGCAGVGESFHADIRFKNQRPRIHIFMEMSWSASRALQGCGRTHRTGQVCPPTYVFVSVDKVPGEKRFSSTPARRIAALGALTRGQREAADNGLFRAEDNLETPYAEKALRALLGNINAGKVEGLNKNDFFLQTGIDVSSVEILDDETPAWPPPKTTNGVRMTSFLNRMLSSDIASDGGFQGRLMDAFIEQLETVIETEMAAGTYDVGVETFKPLSLTIANRETLHADSATGATADLLTLTIQDRPLDWNTFESVCAKRGFYVEESGKTDALFMADTDGHLSLHIPTLHRTPTIAPTVRMLFPTGERTRFASNSKGFTPLADQTAAKAQWEAELAATPLVHRTLYAVTGTLLAVWARLPQTLPVVYRMQTDDGERILARVVREMEIEAVRATFGLSALAA